MTPKQKNQLLIGGAVAAAAVGLYLYSKQDSDMITVIDASGKQVQLPKRTVYEAQVLQFFQDHGWLDQLKRDKVAAMSMADLELYHRANVLQDPTAKEASWLVSIANGWGNNEPAGNYARLQTMQEELTRNWGVGNPWIAKTMAYLKQGELSLQKLVCDYWLDYHVMGRGGQAPAGMMASFQEVINKMVAAGAWPNEPAD